MRNLAMAVLVSFLVVTPAHAAGQSRDDWRRERHKIEEQRWKVEAIARKLASGGVSVENRASWGRDLRQENENLKALLAAQPKSKEHGFRGERGFRNAPLSEQGAPAR